jgi:hypothetical protein
MRGLTAGITALCITLGLVAVVSVTMATPASAATVYAKPYLGLTLKGGPGHPASVFAGLWYYAEPTKVEKGNCIDFSRHNPSGSGTVLLKNGVIPGMTAAASAKANTIQALHAGTRNKAEAAAAALAIWALTPDKNFKTWYKWATTHGVISVSMKNLVTRYLAVNVGPYKATVASTAVLPGQTTRVTVVVKTTRGLPAPAGLRVSLAAGNAKLLRTTGVTNASGVFITNLTRTGVGTVTVSAKVTVPLGNKAWLTNATPGTQRLLIAATGVISASMRYSKSPGRPAIVTQCDTNCNGIATVTATYCNPAGASTVHWTWTNVATGSVTMALLVKPGTCGKVVKKIADATRLQAAYCTWTTACTSAYVKIGSPVEIVCPPWAGASVTVSLGCVSCSVTNVTFTVPASTRFYVGTVTIGGKTVNTNLATGGTTNVPLDQFGVIKGQTVTVVVGFKAYRDEARTLLLKDVALGQVTVTAA